MNDCGHGGGCLPDDLPCPDPHCGFKGTELIAPVLHQNSETGRWETGTKHYTRAKVADARLPEGGYWRWDGPEFKETV